MSKRIWELDAARGLCILGMVLVHLVYDIRELYNLADFAYPAIFSFVMHWGSVLFLLISGICVTLGHHPVMRGLVVFRLRYALQPGYGRHVPTGLPGPGDHHLVWNPPLPGDLHAPVALVGAAALLGLGAIGRPPSGSGIWVPKHHGVGSLAVPPGPDHGGVCLQRLFSPPAQPGVVPDRRPPGPDGLPEGRESPATGAVWRCAGPGFGLVRQAVSASLSAPSASAGWDFGIICASSVIFPRHITAGRSWGCDQQSGPAVNTYVHSWPCTLLSFNCRIPWDFDFASSSCPGTCRPGSSGQSSPGFSDSWQGLHSTRRCHRPGGLRFHRGPGPRWSPRRCSPCPKRWSLCRYPG